MFALLSLLACEATTVDDSDTDVAAPAPDWCPSADRAQPIQEVLDTPAGPYLVHHPADAGAAPTVLFLPGGPGDRPSAGFSFDNWLTQGNDGFRVVVVFADDGDLTDETARVLDVRDEVATCWGITEAHLAGTSNGGVGAYAQMLARPDAFVDLLGAPGAFEGASDAQLTTALAGKRVFNGVGAADTAWVTVVEETHTRLTGLGIDSRYEVFPGQGHVLDSKFDEGLFFAFWRGE